MVCGLFFGSIMSPKSVSAFIDGFNFYHAVVKLGKNHLKWVNLWSLCKEFVPGPEFVLRRVYYFSAYATWLQASFRRHVHFVKALRASGITTIMGEFKEKELHCKICNRNYPSHEEKESDVNLALHLFKGAVRDEYDRALLITCDGDLIPAVQMVRELYPTKEIRLITPPGRKSNKALLRAAGCKESLMKVLHLERNLLPREILDDTGSVVAVRPAEYDPPASVVSGLGNAQVAKGAFPAPPRSEAHDPRKPCDYASPDGA